MWEKLFDTLLKLLDRVALWFSVTTIANQRIEIATNEVNEKVRQNVKDIKEANTTLSRDDLIERLSGK